MTVRPTSSTSQVSCVVRLPLPRMGRQGRNGAREFSNLMILVISGQGADEYVRFKVQPVGTKDPVSVSNHVDVTPGPGVQFNRQLEFKA